MFAGDRMRRELRSVLSPSLEHRAPRDLDLADGRSTDVEEILEDGVQLDVPAVCDFRAIVGGRFVAEEGKVEVRTLRSDMVSCPLVTKDADAADAPRRSS